MFKYEMEPLLLFQARIHVGFFSGYKKFKWRTMGTISVEEAKRGVPVKEMLFPLGATRLRVVHQKTRDVVWQYKISDAG